MASKKKRAKAPRSTRGQVRPARTPWLTPEARQQLRGVLFGCLGLGILLSLITIPNHGNLIGQVGESLSGALTVAVGRVVALGLPALLMWWCWMAFMGKRPEHTWAKWIGAVVLIVSICGIMGTLTRTLDKEITLAWSGFVGVYLSHETSGGLILPRHLGTVGTMLLFIGTGVAGLLMATEILFTDMMRYPMRLLSLVASKSWAGIKSITARTWELVSFGGGSSKGDEAKPQPLVRSVKLGPREDAEEFEEPAPAAVAAPVAPVVKSKSRVLNPRAAEVAETGLLSSAPRPKADPLIIDHEETPPPRKLAKKEKKEKRKRGDLNEDAPTREMETNGDTVQGEFDLSRPYELPPNTLLNEPRRAQHKMSVEEIRDLSDLIERTLNDFGIDARVEQVTQGPVITRFEIKPAAGVKVNRIVSLQNDLKMALCAKSVRIQAPIPGKALVGIEVPNRKPNFVYFRELVESEAFQGSEKPLRFVLGKHLTGEPCILDLAKMPHLLIAGATGAGKSVGLNSLICSILMSQPPDKVKLMLIDPKRVEFSIYDAIPHLISPVITDSRKAPSALEWMVEHMEDRYKELQQVGVRNIDAHNRLVQSDQPEKKAMGKELKYMPHIVVVIDELADLMNVAKAEVEENVQRIAQKARAVGIHLVLATQRPSVKVITGVIKANLPARVAFRVSQKVDSRVIIDQMGADQLLGNGDLLFSTGSAEGPQRMQGAFIADDEVERLCEFILAQEKACYVKTDFTSKVNGKGAEEPMGEDDFDEDISFDDLLEDQMFRRAAVLILENRKASVSLIQRRLKIGFARAGRLMDQMEQAGIVGPYQGSKPREIMGDPEEWLERLQSPATV